MGLPRRRTWTATLRIVAMHAAAQRVQRDLGRDVRHRGPHLAAVAGGGRPARLRGGRPGRLGAGDGGGRGLRRLDGQRRPGPGPAGGGRAGPAAVPQPAPAPPGRAGPDRPGPGAGLPPGRHRPRPLPAPGRGEAAGQRVRPRRPHAGRDPGGAASCPTTCWRRCWPTRSATTASCIPWRSSSAGGTCCRSRPASGCCGASAGWSGGWPGRSAGSATAPAGCPGAGPPTAPWAWPCCWSSWVSWCWPGASWWSPSACSGCPWPCSSVWPRCWRRPCRGPASTPPTGTRPSSATAPASSRCCSCSTRPSSPPPDPGAWPPCSAPIPSSRSRIDAINRTLHQRVSKIYR